MPSKKNKAGIKSQLDTMPVNPITITFVSVLRAEFRKDATNRITEVAGVDVTKLPETVTDSITVERLKGFQYSDEFKALLNKPNAAFYENEAVFLSTEKSEGPVKASLRTLTDSVSLLSWMLNNAPKLYLDAVALKTGGRIYDRNYAEICGKFHAQDVTKAYVSKDATKYVKADIKDISAANAVVTSEEHAGSPIRTMRNAVFALPGIAEKVEARRIEAAAVRAQKMAERKLLAAK